VKSIQYIFENNVIRLWNDEILNADFGEPLVLSTNEIEEKIQKYSTEKR
jgi:hypothetical protein